MKDALMEYETIDAAQIADIMSGEKPRKPKGWDDRNRELPPIRPDEPDETDDKKESAANRSDD
jgi:cell division protease FtsH